MKTRNKAVIIVSAALIIKLSLFLFSAIRTPQAKFLPDSNDYLKLADMLTAKRVFATQGVTGEINYERFRSPGYPFFLAVFHGALKIPLDAVIFMQIIMTLLAAFIIYMAANQVDHRIALLSAVIMLFDPPVTIFSLMVLTETLFLLLISLFMLSFTFYIRKRDVFYIAAAALALALATYVRSISYYLGFALFIYLLYLNRRNGLINCLKHALIFLLIVYSTLGLWQARNYARFHSSAFSSAANENSAKMLFRRYARNNDPNAKGKSAPYYYINTSVRCALSFMTKPGSLKYFKSGLLTAAGKIIGYPWVFFWLIGFIWGALRFRQDFYLQFMLIIVSYFTLTSVVMLAWDASERYRLPMVPALAIISAYGWADIISIRRRKA